MSHTLWTTEGNGRAAKILIAAEIANVPLNVKFVTLQDLKSAEYLQKHPLGKVPLIETPEGIIYESFAILRYIARKSNSLCGSNPFESAQVQNWLNGTLLELDPLVAALLGALGGNVPLSQEGFNAVIKSLREWAKTFDTYIVGKEYLVGTQLSVADISVASYLHWALRLNFDDKFRSQIHNLLKWYQKISALPAFSNTLGKTWYAKKEFVPVCCTDEAPTLAQKKDESDKTQKVDKKQKTDKPKTDKPKDDKPKADKPKTDKPKVQKPKEQKPKEQKKKDKKKKDDDDEESPDEAPVEKKVNPLDVLPKSTFVLDDFKREISNTADKATVMKNFWEKYDPAGWSIWKTVYEKYEGEGVVGYLTCNLKNGFLRNLDHFRKYAFAGFGVYGTEGHYDIKGVWLWRGTEIPEEIRDHQSYDYYKITKLDHNNEADRKLLEEYWSNLEEGQLVEGSPIYEAKYFK